MEARANGTIEFRIMCLPEQVPEVQRRLEGSFEVLRVGRPYPCNRERDGKSEYVRVYLSALLGARERESGRAEL